MADEVVAKALQHDLSVGALQRVVVASQRISVLKRQAVTFGLLYGAAVYFFMNYVVLPLSAVGHSPFKLGLFLNGVLGHALFVGVPIAWFARRAR